MEIRHFEAFQMEKVCDLLATEFFHDPVLNFTFSDDKHEIRMEKLRSFFRIYVNLSRDYGGILLAENNTGVLVYFLPEFMAIAEEINERIDNQLREECGSDYSAVISLLDGLNGCHPQTPEHYYVFLIAVKHSHRRTGIATALLSRLNTILDARNAPCYAECTTPGTQNLFRRAGYSDHRSPLDIEGFPSLFPVWRMPE